MLLQVLCYFFLKDSASINIRSQGFMWRQFSFNTGTDLGTEMLDKR